MRLLIINNYFESHRGGLELIGGRLARELVRLGEDVRWLASDVTPPASDPELGPRSIAVRVCNITERRFGLPFPIPGPGALWRIRREIESSDAVLLQDCIYPISAIAFFLARLYRRPIIIAQHVGIVSYSNPLLRLTMALLNRILARPMLAGADRVAFFSEITAKYFADVQCRLPAEILFTGVDTGLFRPTMPECKPELRNRLGLAGDRPIALFVGRFVEKKGLHILSRMARRRPDIQWAFVGWGHLDPESWKLPNVFVFHGLSGAQLVPLYQASDVFVLPSKGEGFPLVIQEALACGLPVVCSVETVEADAAVAPFLSPVPLDERDLDATAGAFCAKIDMILAEDGASGASAEDRFNFVADRYSWEKCASKYLKLIRSIPALAERRSSLQLDRPASNRQ